MSFSSDLRDCLRFWSRLPVGPAHAAPDLTRSVRALPIAGLVIATPAVVALLAAQWLVLPPLFGASAAIAVLAATTGALHEDGLADAADGLFGGTTRERRLDIMRDSRIGSYGSLALIASFVARVAALAALLQASPLLASTALFATAAVSRTAGLLPTILLPPARPDGLGSGFGSPDRSAMRVATILAACALLLPVVAGLSIARALLAGGLALGAAWVVTRTAREKIGGQTGDIAGAAQQLAEVACLGVLSGGAGA